MTPSEKSLEKLPGDGMALYERLRQYLLEIDTRIDELDKILARLQPPIDGRVKIAWRKDGSTTVTACRPNLVRWKRQGEQWRSERLGLKSLVQKLPRSGAFYYVREELRETVRHIGELLSRRAAIVEAVQRMEQAVQFTIDRNQENLKQASVAIEDLQKRAALLPCTWRDGAMEDVPPEKQDINAVEMDEDEMQFLIEQLDAL